tara:strand:+ start:114 stop:545 length:432 start_codon:yes stop_codon:yes gene_type:complete
MKKKNLSQKQVNLIAWIKQKWRTKSGKKSSSTRERYLPEKAIKALSKHDYEITSKLKRKISKKGKQYSKQPKYIVEQVRKHRNEYKYKVLKKKTTNYTDPYLRKKLFLQIKAAKTHGTKAGQWSARKAQFLAKKYKKMGGDYF